MGRVVNRREFLRYIGAGLATAAIGGPLLERVVNGLFELLDPPDVGDIYETRRRIVLQREEGDCTLSGGDIFYIADVDGDRYKVIGQDSSNCNGLATRDSLHRADRYRMFVIVDGEFRLR